MNAISATKSMDIFSMMNATKQAFLPHLEAHRAQIEQVKRKTFTYGDTARHQLDVYYPPRMQTAVGKKAPVLFYVYGGGFIMGSRISPPPYDLSFTNLGAFFAYAGIIAVIPDYRLVPEVKHPQGVEDVRDAIAWTVDHASEIFVQEGSSVQPDLDRIFVLGHSAGAIHAATLVLLPGLLHPGLRQRIRGVILQCGQYDLSPPRPGQEQAVMEKYYGTAEVMRVGSPRFLLEQAAASSSSTLMVFPKVLVTHGEWEPSDVIQQSEQFALALREKLGDGGEIELRVMNGHNHMSPVWSVMSGAGEEWAVDVVEWINAGSKA